MSFKKNREGYRIDTNTYIGLFEFPRTSVWGYYGHVEVSLDVGTTLPDSSDETRTREWDVHGVSDLTPPFRNREVGSSTFSTKGFEGKKFRDRFP